MTDRFAYAFQFATTDPDINVVYRDIIGNYITNNPKKIISQYRKLMKLYSIWLENPDHYDDVAEDFERESDRYETYDIPKDVILSRIKSEVKIVKVYLDDLVAVKMKQYKKYPSHKSKVGNFPETLFITVGNHTKYWSIITDTYKKASDYLENIFNDDGRIDEVKLNTKITSKSPFTYIAY